MSRVAASAGARNAAGTVGLVVVLAAAGLPGALGGVIAQTTTATTTAPALPTIALSFTDTQSTPAAVTEVTEGGGAQTVRVAATASAAAAAQVDVTITVGDTGGTASGPGTGSADDYQASAGTVTVTIANGATSGSSGDITITPSGDDRVEGDETIRFTAAAVAGYQAIPAADLVLVDDDDAVALSLSPGAVLEHTASQNITVTATFAGTASDLAAATEVTVTVAGGSGMDGAVLAADPSAPASGDDFWTDLTSPANRLTVSIPAGALSGSGSFGLTARVDSVDETAAAEKVALSGSAAVGAKTVTATAELAIHDGVVTLGLVDGSGDELTAVGEDDGNQTVRVTASVPAAPPVSLPVSVVVGGSGSTADKGADDDFTTTAGAAVDFSIGASATSGASSDFVVTPRPDFVTEDHETIEFAGSSTVAGYVVEAAEL